MTAPAPPRDEFILVFNEAAAEKYQANPSSAEFRALNAVLNGVDATLDNSIGPFFNILASSDVAAQKVLGTLLGPAHSAIIQGGYRKPAMRWDQAPKP